MAKHHSGVEVATKLAQANRLARQGKPQSEIARTLRVSVPTLHRWRKEVSQPDRAPSGGIRLAELQLENSRLRRLATDILLETIKLKDVPKDQKFLARGDENGHPNKWPACLSEKFHPAWISLLERAHVSAKTGISKRAKISLKMPIMHNNRPIRLRAPAVGRGAYRKRKGTK